MANELQTNLDAILNDKNTNLLPENLKAGVTCLGVEGTLTGGIDTSSDNPILADDVAEGKEGFVNDKKVVGIVPKVVANLVVQANDVQLFDDEQKMWFSHIYDEDHPNGVMYPKFTWNQIESSYSEVAEKIGLTADKVKYGEKILGLTGTLRHWVPPEVKLVDLKQWLTGYPYLTDRDTVFFIVEGTANKCHVLRKSDQVHFELTNTGSISSSNYAMIWPKTDGHWLYVGDHYVNEYDEDFNFVNTLYNPANKVYPYYDSHTQDIEAHLGAYKYGHLVLLTYTGTSSIWYDEQTNEVYTIDFPMASTSYAPFLVDDNTLCYFETANKKLWTYKITEKELTSENLTDYSSNFFWRTDKANFTGTGYIGYCISGNEVKIKLNDGTWKNIGKAETGSIQHTDTEIIWLTNDSTAKTATVSKCNRTTGEITQLYQYTGGTIGIYGDQPIIFLDDYMYLPSKPIKVNTTDGTAIIGNYDGTGNVSIVQCNNEVLHYDSRHFYRLADDGTMTILMTVPTSEAYQYTISVNTQYRFTSGTKDYILLYSIGRDMYWHEPHGHIGASAYVYDVTTKTIRSLFPYYGGVQLPFSTHGNGTEFSIELHEDLENSQIYFCVVPSIGGMTHGAFIAPLYVIKLANNSWSLQPSPIYSGPSIGGGYMYVSPNIISNGKEQFEIDQWSDISDSANYWNYSGCVEDDKEILFAIDKIVK